MASLPDCRCGENNWEQKGGASSPMVSNVSYSCKECGRKAIVIERYLAGQGFFFKDELKDQEERWLNEVLFPFWVQMAKQFQMAQNKVHDDASEREWLSRGWSGRTYESLSKKEGMDWQGFMRDFRANNKNFKVPPGFEKYDIPPKIPKGFDFYILETRGDPDSLWIKVNHEESNRFEAPIHPKRLAHENEFNEFFMHLESVFGPVKRREIVNLCCDNHNNEPWYEFIIGNIRFQLGPRNNDHEIRAFPAGETLIKTQAIQELARRRESPAWIIIDGRKCYPTFRKVDGLASEINFHSSKPDLFTYLNLIIEENQA